MQEALDFNQGSIIEPIYLSTSQAYRDADEMEAALAYKVPTWCYSRIANPSNYYLEGVLALLEGFGGDFETSCVVTSSGASAIMSVIDQFLNPVPGKKGFRLNFVAPAQVYGGTFQQFSIRKEKERDIEWRKVINPADLNEWKQLIDENTRFLYGELPSNPCLAFFDIKAVADLAHAHDLPLIVDSTVATPALLRPLLYGADIVVQSVTKSLFSSGFGICGAVISRKNITSNIDNPEMKADFAELFKVVTKQGQWSDRSPMNAILAINDIRWFRTRMESA